MHGVYKDIESYLIPGGRFYDRYFDCPLDYDKPEGETIKVFVRQVVPEDSRDISKLPIALYLQGGPGFQSGYPTNVTSGWQGVLLSQGYQILLLDQRGTGLSTAINAQSKGFFKKNGSAKEGGNDGEVPQDMEQQIDYIKNFRADSIVKDCEWIRKIITKECGDDNANANANEDSMKSRKYTLVGQSFGGFVITTYLSLHPEGVEKCIITGGIPPLLTNNDPTQVYESLIKKVIARNIQYYSIYKRDIGRVKRIVEYLNNNNEVLPGGGKLTARRFQQIGIEFGISGGFAHVHRLILNITNDLDTCGRITFKSKQEIESFHSFDTNVIYAILHEAIYCNGNGVSSNWACQRAIESNVNYKSWFDNQIGYLSKIEVESDTQVEVGTGAAAGGGGVCDEDRRIVLFYGEMIFDWMFEDYAELKKFKQLADALAEYKGWTKLYDVEQLRKNRVPVVASCYYDDPYVDLELSMETSKLINKCKVWITNEYLHNGLAADSRVIARLLGMFKTQEI